MITTFPSSACLCKLKERRQGSHPETAAADYACVDALCIAEVDLKSRQVKFEPGNLHKQGHRRRPLWEKGEVEP